MQQVLSTWKAHTHNSTFTCYKLHLFTEFTLWTPSLYREVWPPRLNCSFPITLNCLTISQLLVGITYNCDATDFKDLEIIIHLTRVQALPTTFPYLVTDNKLTLLTSLQDSFRYSTPFPHHHQLESSFWAQEAPHLCLFLHAAESSICSSRHSACKHNFATTNVFL